MNELSSLDALVEKYAPALGKPGVLAVRPGYRLENGWPTRQPAIVVIRSQDAAAIALPASIEGVPVDVRPATDVEQFRHDEPERFAQLAARHGEFRGGAFTEIDPADDDLAAAAPDAELAAAKPQVPYTPAAVPLAPVRGLLSFTCHASPDAGWPTLKAFLAGTRSSLKVSLYDFTSKHILDGVEASLAGNKIMAITLDNPARNPTADQSDQETLQALSGEFGESFQSAWALVRSNGVAGRWIYPNAYHIKVAVRDDACVWLSSGNWNNSNQPDIDPLNAPAAGDQATARKSDRDWHVVIANEALAKTFAAYLEHDFRVASEGTGGAAPLAAGMEMVLPEVFRTQAIRTFEFHPPLELKNVEAVITPLLTPDPGVYQPAMLALLGSAATSLYVQLQYIHPPPDGQDEPLTALIDVLAKKINSGKVDVRIILGQVQLSQGWLERLQAAGVSLEHVRIQHGVHNKGFVVDSRTVALGSQNWSGDGVLRNRDATVIIENAEAARYYEKIFLHDWDRLARQSAH